MAKRQKKVFSTIDETCHAWAHSWEELKDGRNGTGNVLFDGPTIYSYGSHFPMANFVKGANGELVVLTTNETYSVSTANHMRSMSSAISHLTSFEVPEISAHWNKEIDHAANWRYLRSELNAARNHLHNAKRPTRNMLDACDRASATMNSYADTFDTGEFRNVETFSQNERAEHMQRIDREYANASERHQAARERAEIATAERVAAEQIRDRIQSRLELIERLTLGLYKAPRPTWKYGYQSYQSYGNRNAPRDSARELARKLSAWKRCETGARMPSGYDGPVLMRLNRDADTVETSGHARFPVSDCRDIWPFIAKCAEQSRRFEVNKTRKLGMYAVDHITETGDVKAGCHFVTFAECRKLAIVLGMVKPTRAEVIAHRTRKLFKFS